MKKFRILGVLAIIVIVVEFIFSFAVGWESASDSFMEGYNSVYENRFYQTASVDLKPLSDTRLDSLSISLSKENVPYKIEKIRVPIVPSIWTSIITFFGVFFTFALLIGLYCLIRLFISISKRDVFTGRNVLRIRIFTYSLVAFSFLNSLTEWFNYLEVTKQIVLPGYEVKSFEMSADWLLLVIVVLFTEIFAVGVKLKQEQDLTI